jgi:hypothetical protein
MPPRVGRSRSSFDDVLVAAAAAVRADRTRSIDGTVDGPILLLLDGGLDDDDAVADAVTAATGRREPVKVGPRARDPRGRPTLHLGHIG